MLNTWIISASSGLYTSNYWASSSSTGESFFSNQISFAFYNDPACTILSSGESGIINLIQGRSSINAAFQPIITGFDLSSPITVNFNGVANQLQVQIDESLVNTKFIKIFFERG